MARRRRSPITSITTKTSEITKAFRARYEAARSGGRVQKEWARATGEGPTKVVEGGLERLRMRSRYEVANDEWASRAVDILVGSVVGGGIRPHITDPALAKLWKRWATQSDADGTMTFHAQQALAMREVVEAGEVLARIRERREEDGLAVPLQVQLIEPEHLPVGTVATLPQSVRAGIEFGPFGNRKAYWLYKAHPADVAGLSGQAPELRRVPAEQVLHVFQTKRAGQVRGVPWLSSTILRLHNMSSYESAELQRKETAALFSVIVSLPSADDDVSDVLGLQSEEAVDEEGKSFNMAPLESGAIIGAPPGATVTTAAPADVGANYKDFWATQFRGVGAGVGVPYHLLTGDYSGHNDRTLRVVNLAFARDCRRHQDMLNQGFNRPVWRAFVSSAVEAGLWSPPAGTELSDWLEVEWIPEPFGHIHPTQEVKAQTDAIRSGVKTLGQVLRESGSDLETYIAERKAENAAIDAAGLILDSDPRRTNWRGGFQDTSPKDDEEEDAS